MWGLNAVKSFVVVLSLFVYQWTYYIISIKIIAIINFIIDLFIILLFIASA